MGHPEITPDKTADPSLRSCDKKAPVNHFLMKCRSLAALVMTKKQDTRDDKQDTLCRFREGAWTASGGAPLWFAFPAGFGKSAA